MRTMALAAIRSTALGNGLVALLVETDGPGVLAVPVSAREGITLSAPDVAPRPTWPGMVAELGGLLGGRAERVLLDVDADAHLCASVILSRDASESTPTTVACTPSDGLVLAQTLSLPIMATAAVLRLRQVDLDGEDLCDRLAAWRAELVQATAADAGGA
ncbi:MAG: DUF151 domain-containing protein [Actinomyces sp.]|uniref:bifunctional nuclease domain-containing protein n=1 Tax=Actinomyces sp. TaxID=29317 RepID=UPI0026DDC758|nr:bifunctional nuclease domain-containing protein [Actinomyces sp.]MDO4243323.1 DUF151 domain-containing protein [Actinomyces sp.]